MRRRTHYDGNLFSAGLFLAVWTVGALASLALVGVIIWGIIRLVLAVTG